MGARPSRGARAAVGGARARVLRAPLRAAAWVGALLASGCATVPTAVQAHMALQRGDEASCGATRTPDRGERERFRRMRLDDDTPQHRWLRGVIEGTAWWRDAALERAQLEAYRVSHLVGPREPAFLVEVNGAADGERRHGAAIFVVRVEDPDRDRPGLRGPPDLLWSSERDTPRNLGVMVGDDRVVVLYWEELFPSRSEHHVGAVGRYEPIGHGWLAWYQGGSPVVRAGSCLVIPPV